MRSDDDCSDTLLTERIVSIKEHLISLGYEQSDADAWLRTPQSLLYGQRAMDLLRTDWGYLEVAGVVQRLCDGAFI